MNQEGTNLVRTLSAGGPKELLGGKAHRLSILAKYFDVPLGFVVTTKAYEEWEKNQRIPEDLIEKYFRSPYGLEGQGPVIARSSANVENGNKASFSGVFESYSNLQTIKEILDAIEKIFKGARSERAIAYCKAMDIDPNTIKMGCLIQKMIIPEYSGVLFTRSPNNYDYLVVEYVQGLWQRETKNKAPYRISLKRKSIKNLLKDSQRELHFLKDLVRIALEIEDIFEKPQDVEWAYSEERIYILQSRDIISPLKRTTTIESKKYNKGLCLKGTPASPGKTQGIAQFILDDQPPDEGIKLFKKGSILVTYVLHAEYYPIFIKAKGIVTKVDSILSHPAIFARELGIPCVVGVNIEHVVDGDVITVDGDKGEVRISNPRLVLKQFELSEVRRQIKSEEAKRIREEYIEALENLDVEKLKIIIKECFAKIKELYLSGRKEESLDLYYLINSLLEETTPALLSQKFKDLIDILQRADKKEKPKNEVESKIFRIYELIKGYVNYQTEDSKDIPTLLFGLPNSFENKTS